MKSFLRVIVLATIATHVSAGGGFQLNEHGARAVGQGGAWVARAYDPSAIFFNPAGLAFQSGTWISLGTTIIAPSATFYGVGTGATPMKSQTFTPINGYITSSLSDDLAVGIGVYNPYGLGTDWGQEWRGWYVTTKADLISFYVTPTIAYRVSDNLSIGASINYATGAAKLSRIVSDPFGQEEYLATIDASGTGWGFNVGMIYKATDDISFGASYRSGVSVDATGTVAFDKSRSFLVPGDVSTPLNLPGTAYVGVAYSGIDNLELEIDYQFVGWSSYDSLSVTFKSDGTTSSDPKLYKDTYILRAGGEYTMGQVQIRAGYFFDNNPVPDGYVEPTLPDVNRHGFNVGLGYEVSENIRVDAFYMYIKGVQRTVANTYVGFDGTYSTTASLFGVNIGYSF